MAFSETTKQIIFNNAGGQCQCQRVSCNHLGRCQKVLNITPQQHALASLLGTTLGYIGFEFHHIQSQIAGGADSPQNGAFLCTFCHQQTNSYGTNLTGAR